jgi:phage terminase large subunit
MALTTPQQTIFDDPARFRVVAAGRRFGKTYLSMYEIARIARFPNKRIFYVAPTYRMGKQIIWEDLKQQLSDRKWVKRINESDLTITLVNNSRISVRSADNFDSMRGVSLDFIVLDECAFMDREVWTEVLRPTLSDRQGGALFITTPKGFNWVYDMWTYAKTADTWSAFQYTTVEGGNVTPEEVESARHDLDLKTFQQEYEASFENAGHIIYHSFDIEHNVKSYTDDIPKILHLGCDFNINPISGVIGVKNKTGMHIIDEIVISDSNTDELAQEVVRRYPGYTIVAYPDPAGAQRKTSAVGRTDHSILQQYGFEIKAHRRHTAVNDRINAVNKMYCDAAGERRLFIDPRCRKTIECVTKHQYKEGTRVPDKESGYDHQNDAVGYLIDYLYPIRRPHDQTENQPTIWGVY